MWKNFCKRRVSLILLLFFLGLCYLVTIFLQQGALYESKSNRYEPVSATDIKLQQYIQHFRINWTCNQQEDSSSSMKLTPWQLAESFLSPRSIMDYDNQNQLGCVLKAMRDSRITHADVGTKGTQLKASLTLEGGQRVIFKPKFYERDYVMVGTAYAGKDRHYAEIAAFHVNRVIGLYKVPLVVGRVVNLDTEVKRVAHKNLLQTFYSREGNTCFYGKCYYCKGPETGVCATGSQMEGSVTLWLPEAYALSQAVRHPWARTYNPNKKAKWESDENYCQTVTNTRPYETPPRLLDLIDIAVFDFLISNADRHHYETFEYSKDSTVVALDNGKSFGNPYVDELSILTPLTQCCKLRETTYNRLKDLADGVLGKLMDKILADEPIGPVLSPLHYKALDRRLAVILKTVSDCIKTKNKAELVLVSDGY